MQNQFQRAEDEYFKLRGQLSAGRITREQFDAALQALMLSDAQGRRWMLGVDSGEWYVHEGAEWREANPYAINLPPADLPEGKTRPPPSTLASTEPAPQPAPAAYSVPAAQYSAPATPAKQGGGCGRILLFGCLGFIVLCAVLGIGGFFGVQSGALTPTTLLNLAGMGPGDIVVNNFRDDAIQVQARQLDAPPDETPLQTMLKLNAFDVKNFRVSTPGLYRVAFSTAEGMVFGECTLRLRSGDEYQFVTLPERIVIHRANDTPSTGRELVVATSALCRAR